MQIKSKQIEQKVFISSDGMEFSTAVECRRHEVVQTFLKCKCHTVNSMGEPKYIVNCATLDDLRDVLEFFDNTYSTNAFSSNFNEEDVQSLVPGRIVFEYLENDMFEQGLIYSIDRLITEIDDKIASLNHLKQTLTREENTDVIR